MAEQVKPPMRRAFTGLYARSPSALQMRAERVRRLVSRMRKVMPWIEPSDHPACRAWAELEVLGAQAFAELEKNGLLNASGEPRRLFTDLLRLRGVQITYARELAMTPAARIALKANDAKAAVDLVASMGAEEAELAEAAIDRADAARINGNTADSADAARIIDKPPGGSGDESEPKAIAARVAGKIPQPAIDRLLLAENVRCARGDGEAWSRILSRCRELQRRSAIAFDRCSSSRGRICAVHVVRSESKRKFRPAYKDKLFASRWPCCQKGVRGVIHTVQN